MPTDKRANFKRIAERRTNEILDKIRSFRNFSNSSFYEYTNKDIEAIVEVIVSEIKQNIIPLKKEDK